MFVGHTLFVNVRWARVIYLQILIFMGFGHALFVAILFKIIIVVARWACAIC
jgi:hypothetical protein